MEAAIVDQRAADRLHRGLNCPGRAHLIGIAGSGMRAMADVLLGWGWQLSGSDVHLSEVERLTADGVRLFHGHAAHQTPADADLVVYSDAVPIENVERRRAAELGIPTLSYFDLIGRLSADYNTVAIAGTHGKSTTTAMVAHILVVAGRDPTVFCGATPLGRTSGGRAGRQSSRHTPCAVRPVVASDTVTLLGERHTECACYLGERHTECACYDEPHTECACCNRTMIVEACEYRANFQKLRPRQAAILGIEPDHFDCYESLGQLEEAFRRFAALLPRDGLLVARHDCASTRRATAGLSCRVESFGLTADADWSAQGLTNHAGRYAFEIRHAGQPFGEVRLQTPGRHNVLNALAAAALAWANGLTAEQIVTGLEGFAGLHRRLEIVGTRRGVTLVDDYAHHPTEVAAALATVREMFPGRRVWALFQPHQASRTARLLDELAESLQNADRVLVAEIFRAREGDPRPGEVTAADLARRTAEGGVAVLPNHGADEIVETLETHLAPGDVLVTLGAGDVSRLRPALRGGGL